MGKSDADLQPDSPVLSGLHSPQSANSPTAPHMRRKSVLPIDPQVMRDLEVGFLKSGQ